MYLCFCYSGQTKPGIDFKMKIKDRLPPGFQYPTSPLTIPSTSTPTSSPTTTVKPTTKTTTASTTVTTSPTTVTTSPTTVTTLPTTTITVPTEGSTVHTSTITPEPATSKKGVNDKALPITMRTAPPTNTSNVQHLLDHILSYDRRIRPNIFGNIYFIFQHWFCYKVTLLLVLALRLLEILTGFTYELHLDLNT